MRFILPKLLVRVMLICITASAGAAAMAGIVGCTTFSMYEVEDRATGQTYYAKLKSLESLQKLASWQVFDPSRKSYTRMPDRPIIRPSTPASFEAATGLDFATLKYSDR